MNAEIDYETWPSIKTIHHETLNDASPTLIELDSNFQRVPSLFIPELEQFQLNILQRIADPNFIYGYYHEFKRGYVRTYYVITNGVFTLKFKHTVVLPDCPICGNPKLFMLDKGDIICEHYEYSSSKFKDVQCKFRLPLDWRAAEEEFQKMKGHSVGAGDQNVSEE